MGNQTKTVWVSLYNLQVFRFGVKQLIIPNTRLRNDIMIVKIHDGHQISTKIMKIPMIISYMCIKGKIF